MTHSSNECSGRYSCTGPLPPSLQACNRSLCSILQPWARVFQIDCHARFAVICAQIAYTYRHTAYKATARTIPRLPRAQVSAVPALTTAAAVAGSPRVAKSIVQVLGSAQINQKRGQEKEFQRRRGLPARRARAGAPRATDRPPGATPRGPGRSGFPATSQRGSEVYGPHIIRAGHGRVRRVARVTARGGAVRDEDH